ncbi:MAG: polysaccharide biosynthesis/export family protein [Pseudomonadota bacterium]
MKVSQASVAALLVAACSTPITPPDTLAPAPWPTANLPADVFFAPGDTVEIVFHTAPELTRTVTVAADGTLRLPFIDPIPAAAANTKTVKRRLQSAYRAQLVDPSLDVLPVSQAPAQVFVGGAVAQTGAVELNGPTDLLQAIIMAGGPTEEARLSDVLLMRRDFDGTILTRRVDLTNAFADPASADLFPLARYDVIHVPRSRIANQNRFVSQYLRRALPLDFFVFYDLSNAAD